LAIAQALRLRLVSLFDLRFRNVIEDQLTTVFALGHGELRQRYRQRFSSVIAHALVGDTFPPHLFPAAARAKPGKSPLGSWPACC
jgi:hypothetical protein